MNKITLSLLVLHSWLLLPTVHVAAQASDNYALHAAITDQDEAQVQALLIDNSGTYRARAKINKKDNNGEYPIHLAAQEGDEEIIRLLLGHPKLKINRKDSDQNSALHITLKEEDVEATRLLLTHKEINPNIQGAGNKLPLEVAIGKNNLDLVQALFKNPKTDPQLKASTGTPCIDLAQQGTQIYRYLHQLNPPQGDQLKIAPSKTDHTPEPHHDDEVVTVGKNDPHDDLFVDDIKDQDNEDSSSPAADQMSHQLQEVTLPPARPRKALPQAASPSPQRQAFYNKLPKMPFYQHCIASVPIPQAQYKQHKEAFHTLLLAYDQQVTEQTDLTAIQPFQEALKRVEKAPQSLHTLLKSVGELMQHSKACHEPLLKTCIIGGIRKRFNQSVTIKDGGIKKVRRILEKTCEEEYQEPGSYKGNPARVVDILRFTVSCKSIEQLLRVVRFIFDPHWSQQGILVHRIKNRLGDRCIPTTHYRDYSLMLYSEKYQTYVEMQVTLDKLIEAKKQLHTLYKTVRTLAQEMQAPHCTDSLRKEYSDKVHYYNKAAQDIYDKAWAHHQPAYRNHQKDFLATPKDFYQVDQAHQAQIQGLLHGYHTHQGKARPKDRHLSWFIEKGDQKALTLALIKGFDPAYDGGRQGQATLLQLAYHHNNKAAAQLLREAGAPQTHRSTLEAIDHLHRRQQQEIKQDITLSQGLQMYIPLQASPSPVRNLTEELKSGTIYNLHQTLTAFLFQKEATHTVMLLQGNSGAGKSLYGRYLENFLWKERKPKDPIPLFISLPQAYEKGLRDLVSQALDHKGLQKAAIQELKKYTFYFFFDGFDEIKVRYEADGQALQLPANFYSRFQLHNWPGSKFIISCRSQILSDAESTDLFRAPQQRMLPEHHLAPFSNEKITEYIHHFAKDKARHPTSWKAADYDKAMQAFPQLVDMVRSPFALGLTLSVLPELYATYSEGTTLTRAQLYQAFSQQWFAHQLQRLKGHGTLPHSDKVIQRGFSRYCEELAFTMFTVSKQIAKEPEEGIDVEEQSVWYRFFIGNEARINLAGSPLRRVGDREYMFIHKSYQEYFTARKLLRQLEDPQSVKKWTKDPTNLALGQKILNEEPAIIHFIKRSILKRLQQRASSPDEDSKEQEEAPTPASQRKKQLWNILYASRQEDKKPIQDRIPHHRRCQCDHPS